MFSERLKTSRKEVGLTQVELAEILKVSNGTVGMWETGKREPKFDAMAHLSRVLNKSVDYLLGLSENKSPQPADEIHSIKGSSLQVHAEVIYSFDDYDLVLIKKQ
ncbi:helix-turn-helix domain-containing protein [Youngiibacter fragilis]|uniref:XRE family transcriptional regulator n=1 Tax=Youngiibacter fragilis 232.1 TaxID=994573 RepID=V7I3X9_9CLOT|nr:helix-turn-helix domain-containing protein [Youngiibacter fragilis]ETA80001.1 XRE family transcriptional regulator [Youngiibacter fragilis 232.1]